MENELHKNDGEVENSRWHNNLLTRSIQLLFGGNWARYHILMDT